MKRIDFLKTLAAFFLALGSWSWRTILRYNDVPVAKSGKEAMFYRVINGDSENIGGS